MFERMHSSIICSFVHVFEMRVTMLFVIVFSSESNLIYITTVEVIVLFLQGVCVCICACMHSATLAVRRMFERMP